MRRELREEQRAAHRVFGEQRHDGCRKRMSRMERPMEAAKKPRSHPLQKPPGSRDTVAPTTPRRASTRRAPIELTTTSTPIRSWVARNAVTACTTTQFPVWIICSIHHAGRQFRQDLAAPFLSAGSFAKPEDTLSSGSIALFRRRHWWTLASRAVGASTMHLGRLACTDAGKPSQQQSHGHRKPEEWARCGAQNSISLHDNLSAYFNRVMLDALLITFRTDVADHCEVQNSNFY